MLATAVSEELVTALTGFVGAIVGGGLGYAGTHSLAREQRRVLERQLDAEREARQEATREARLVAQRARVEDDLRVLSAALARFESAVEALAATRLVGATSTGGLLPPLETDLVPVYTARAELEGNIQRLPFEASRTPAPRPPTGEGEPESPGSEASSPRSSAGMSGSESAVTEARPPRTWAEVWDLLFALVSMWPSPAEPARFLEVVDAADRDALLSARERFRSQAYLAHDALRVARSFPDPDGTTSGQ